MLQADSRFETLVEAVQADPLFRDAMGRPNWNHTVLAPRDEAFQALPEQGVRGLLDDPDRLRTWLDNHVLFELVPSDRLAGEELETIRGFHTLQVDDDVIRVDDVEVVEADIVASNGLIHAIDGVLTSLCLKVGVGNPPTCTDLLEGG
ncbi:MAG: fasciclin domain-containing protein [Actinomycetota bacterium]